MSQLKNRIIKKNLKNKFNFNHICTWPWNQALTIFSVCRDDFFMFSFQSHSTFESLKKFIACASPFLTLSLCRLVKFLPSESATSQGKRPKSVLIFIAATQQRPRGKRDDVTIKWKFNLQLNDAANAFLLTSWMLLLTLNGRRASGTLMTVSRRRRSVKDKRTKSFVVYFGPRSEMTTAEKKVNKKLKASTVTRLTRKNRWKM